jgi:PST family polysaccharide transporter
VIQEEQDPAAETLTDRTARAVQWRVMGAVIGVLFQLAVGVLLARLLTPADFGVMTLAVMVLGLAQLLGDLGIGDAVVQRTRLTEHHVRTAFTFSVMLGLAMTAVLMMAAPLGAIVMGDARVAPVLRVLSVRFVFRGTAAVAEALLRRQLNFRRLFFIDTLSYVLGFGGVAITLALLGHGVWSLVWGSLVQVLLASAAQLAAARHSIRPLLVRRRLTDLLHFGFGSTLSRCVNYLALNGDNFVVGRWIGPASLGAYERAYALISLPRSYVANVMSTAMFPAFAQLQGEPARVRRGYLLLTKLTAMVAAPLMVTLAIVAPHLVRSLYGPQWSEVVVPLQILAIAGYFRGLYHLGGVVAQSHGRVYSEMRRQIVYAALVIGGGLVGSRYGVPGVAVGVSVATLFMFIAMAHLALRITETPWHRYFGVQLGALVTAGITCAAALSVRILLEARHASSGAIALGVVAAAAVPFGIAMLRQLGEPDFEPIRARLPRSCARLVDTLRPHRRSTAEETPTQTVSGSPA